MEPEDYPVESRPMIVDVVDRLDGRISCDGLRYSRCMSNEDQQQTASRMRTVRHDRATAPEADRSPAPTALLILASDDDLVCVDDLCLPGEAAAEARTEANAKVGDQTGQYASAKTRLGASAETRPEARP